MKPTVAKQHLRKRFLEIRREMAFEDVYRLSSRIQKRFLSTACFRRAERLSLYSSVCNEPLTDDLFQGAARLSKHVYYPSVVRGKRHLEFFRVTDLDELSSGTYDIKEPGGKDHAVSPDSLDLVIVPGVAFDLAGGRIGFGKGYYDRALRGTSCEIVALAYEFQVLADRRMPMEPHDVRVGAIVTEKRVISTG